jgi:hypothetical protein
MKGKTTTSSRVVTQLLEQIPAQARGRIANLFVPHTTGRLVEHIHRGWPAAFRSVQINAGAVVASVVAADEHHPVKHGIASGQKGAAQPPANGQAAGNQTPNQKPPSVH